MRITVVVGPMPRVVRAVVLKSLTLESLEDTENRQREKERERD